MNNQSQTKNRVLKKNLNAPRPSEHPPVMWEKMSKRLGGIIGCKYKTSSWHLNGFCFSGLWGRNLALQKTKFLKIHWISIVGRVKRHKKNELALSQTGELRFEFLIATALPTECRLCTDNVLTVATFLWYIYSAGFAAGRPGG